MCSPRKARTYEGSGGSLAVPQGARPGDHGPKTPRGAGSHHSDSHHRRLSRPLADHCLPARPRSVFPGNTTYSLFLLQRRPLFKSPPLPDQAPMVRLRRYIDPGSAAEYPVSSFGQARQRQPRYPPCRASSTLAPTRLKPCRPLDVWRRQRARVTVGSEDDDVTSRLRRMLPEVVRPQVPSFQVWT
jgi:hypothetical protein